MMNFVTRARSIPQESRHSRRILKADPALMMSLILLEILVILGLILANGLFSLSELAVIASRKHRLREQANRGHRGAKVALRLSEKPEDFLSTIQLGITLVGTIAGVYGGGTLAIQLAEGLSGFQRLAPNAALLGSSAVVLFITVLTIVLGELAPKRIALSRPERYASALAIPVLSFSRLTLPVVRFLSLLTELVLRPFGIRRMAEPPVTHEEIRVLVREGAKAGVFRDAEHEIFLRVFRFCDRRARSLMTPRNRIVWIDVADPSEEIRRKVISSPHSRFPVCDGSLDNLLGIVHVKALLARDATGQSLGVKGMLTLPHFVYEGTQGLRILEMFRKSSVHTAVVLDEYGSVVGLLTLNDVLEAIVGDLPETREEEEESRVIRRPDGSWLLDGRIAIEDFRDLVGWEDAPPGDYHTLAGMVVNELGHLPSVAESFERGGYRFEVVGVDDRRVEKVLVQPVARRP